MSPGGGRGDVAQLSLAGARFLAKRVLGVEDEPTIPRLDGAAAAPPSDAAAAALRANVREVRFGAAQPLFALDDESAVFYCARSGVVSSTRSWRESRKCASLFLRTLGAARQAAHGPRISRRL